jgi:mannose-6-phosphate isomerase-like protein (cupin superfamily)
VTQPIAPLPGAVGLTDLRVYDWPAPDGLIGGGPHVHLCCTEAYSVIEGAGAVQTLASDGVLQEHSLQPGKIVWFTPGVIHRLINSDGRLRILVIMQNSGLPEAGDFVLTFPREILADRKKYEQHASLAPSGHVYTSDEEAARKRRDMAVDGFIELQHSIKKHGVDAMKEFYRLAVELVKPKLAQWREIWTNGADAASAATGIQLDKLSRGDFEHLVIGDVYSMQPPGEQRNLGMCGTLGVYLPEGITR